MNFFKFDINDESPSWSCGLQCSSDIDFLIWVLEIDGLQTRTYYQHPDGDHSLRSQGLTMESWELWMTESILTRYYRHPTIMNDPRNLKAEQDFDESSYYSIREMGKNKNISPSIVEESIRRHQQKRAKDRQTYLEESTRFYSGKPIPSPGALLVPSQAEPRLIERIHELWDMFRKGIYNQRSQRWDRIQSNSTDLHRQLKPYHSQLRFFHIYLISYPYTTIYLESPVTSLISLSAESRTTQAFYDQAKQAAAELIELNRSI